MPEIAYQYPPIWRVLAAGKPYEPFPWQAQHLHAKVDEGCPRIILPCGRRSGKSTGVVAEVAREVTRPSEEVRGITHWPLVYIIGPTTEASMRVFEPVWNAFVPSDSGDYVPSLGFLYAGHDKNRGVIFLKGGARIYRKTADDPRSLQGERVTLAVPDEAHDTPEEAWENLMPGLSDSGGRLIAIGIPRGKGRFRSYYHAGQGLDPQFYSASVPTTANPIFTEKAARAGLDPEEYLRQQFGQDLTEKEFRRQYLAEWSDEDGQVFANFERLFTAPGYGPEHGGVYPHIMSLDVGKLHDYTVAYIGNVATGQFVASERFTRIDYLDQAPRLAALYHAYRCVFIHMDVTGVGEPVAEMLRAEGCSVVPFKFTNESKQALISTMVRECERGTVSFLADDDPLRREMTLFEGSISPGGVLRYSAPAGFFDDCVTAAALLIQKMARNRGMAANPIRTPYVTFSPERTRSFMPPLPKPKLVEVP